MFRNTADINGGNSFLESFVFRVCVGIAECHFQIFIKFSVNFQFAAFRDHLVDGGVYGKRIRVFRVKNFYRVIAFVDVKEGEGCV